MTNTANFRLHPNTSSLLLIDVQDRLIASMKPKVFDNVRANINRLTHGARALNVHTVVTEQYPKGLGHTDVSIKEGLHPELPIIEKVDFNAACVDEVKEALHANATEEVILTGMEAHICVFQTAIGCLEAGLRVWVAMDAICSRSKDNWRQSLDMMQQAGAVVAPTEAILFTWLGKAGSEEFKAISKSIR